jgi:hypothetical protein
VHVHLLVAVQGVHTSVDGVTAPDLVHVIRLKNNNAGCASVRSVLAEGKEKPQSGKKRNGTKTTTVTVVKAWWRAGNSEVNNESMCDDQTPNQTPPSGNCDDWGEAPHQGT